MWLICYIHVAYFTYVPYMLADISGQLHVSPCMGIWDLVSPSMSKIFQVDAAYMLVLQINVKLGTYKGNMYNIRLFCAQNYRVHICDIYFLPFYKGFVFWIFFR